jgi:MoxR-like ATPase
MIEIYEKLKKGIVGREKEMASIIVAMEAGKHILLEGPPGTSKSTVLRKIARESNILLFIVEGNIDLTPAKLVGYFNPAKVMADSYQPEYFEKGPLTKAMEGGGILYIDEIWSSLRDRYETFAGNGNRQSDARSQHANQEIPSSREQHVKKKINAR